MGLTENDSNVLNLDLSAIEKTKIWINHDENRVIELNLSDVGIIDRFGTASKNLKKLADEVSKLSEDIADTEDDDEETLTKIADRLKELDRSMRDEIDFLFDSKISDVCVPSGTMYDPHGGKFTFEHVIESIVTLYGKSIQDEFNKIEKNVSKHAGKYTLQDHNKKAK